MLLNCDLNFWKRSKNEQAYFCLYEEYGSIVLAFFWLEESQRYFVALRLERKRLERDLILLKFELVQSLPKT